MPTNSRKTGATRALLAYAMTLIIILAASSAVRAIAMDSAGAERLAPSDKIAPWLSSQFQLGGRFDVFVMMSTSADVTAANGLASRAERGQWVYDALRQEAQAQLPLVEVLQKKGYDVTRFWIVNAVLVKGADTALVNELARRPDVGRLVGNPLVNGLAGVTASGTADSGQATPRSAVAVQAPVGAAANAKRRAALRTKRGSVGAGKRARLSPGRVADTSAADITGPSPSTATGVSSRSRTSASGAITATSVSVDGPVFGGLPLARAAFPQAIECGVTTVNADDVWNQTGLRGDGIVVGTMDTGVEWTHPAIQSKYRGWNGATADHSYSWHDAIGPTVAPLDDNNHGTHVTGTMVGDDGAGNQIGLAPGAKWVGCRNMDHGNGTPATYLDCAQWGLAPYPLGADPFKDGRPDLAPDITNNSWSCPPSEGCDAFSLQQAYENVRAAGQMTVGAAQNAGPSCSSITAPLGIYDAVFTIGAVDCAGVLATFSSRGPITVDGSGRLKPDVAAPGVNVRSSVRRRCNLSPFGPCTSNADCSGGSNFCVEYNTLSGTSMATPHTAGALALLWSARPNLRHLVGISRCYMEKSATTATLPSGVPSTCGGTTAANRPNNFWGWGKIDALAAVNLGPDTDADGIADPCDCAPSDGGAFDAPPDVAGDRFTNATTYQWSSLAAISGTGTTYDIVRGRASLLRVSGGLADAVCVANDHVGASYNDADLPPSGDAFYYLARGQNGCGTGGWGRGLAGAERTITSCP